MLLINEKNPDNYLINLWLWINFYCRIMETAPTLPDFALALKPDEYQLPPVDASWNQEHMNKGQTGFNLHKNEER